MATHRYDGQCFATPLDAADYNEIFHSTADALYRIMQRMMSAYMSKETR